MEKLLTDLPTQTNIAVIFGTLFVLSASINVYFVRKIFRDQDKWAMFQADSVGKLTIAMKNSEVSDANTQTALQNQQRALEGLSTIIQSKK